MREPLDWEKSVEEVIAVMAEGDPEALHVLTEIISKNAVGPQLLLDMDDMNIRGRQITVGVKEACLGSIKRFCNMIHYRTPWLVEEINRHVHSHKAVTYGGSETEHR